MKDFVIRHKKRIKKYSITVLKYIIYASVVYFIYNKLNGSLSAIEEIGDIKWGWLIASIGLFSLHSIWNGFNWHYLIVSSDEKVTRMSQMEVYLKSYILRYVPGNIVGILSRATYNKPYGVPMVKSLWGWFFENIVYLALGILIGAYSILVLQFNLAESSILLGLALIIASVVIFKNDWLRFVFNKFLVPKLPKGASEEFKALDVPLRNRLILTIRYLGAWVIYSVSFIFVMKAFGVNDHYLLAISANAMAWSIGYLTLITPSGTGVRESAMIYLLTAGIGLGNETSVIIAVFARVVTIIGELVGFVTFYIYKIITKFTVGKKNVDSKLPSGDISHISVTK